MTKAILSPRNTKCSLWMLRSSALTASIQLSSLVWSLKNSFTYACCDSHLTVMHYLLNHTCTSQGKSVALEFTLAKVSKSQLPLSESTYDKVVIQCCNISAIATSLPPDIESHCWNETEGSHRWVGLTGSLPLITKKFDHFNCVLHEQYTFNLHNTNPPPCLYLFYKLLHSLVSLAFSLYL